MNPIYYLHTQIKYKSVKYSMIFDKILIVVILGRKSL